MTALAERYEIEREIGRGGMATVYLAHDVRHKRSVAVKVLDPELTASLGGARFVREVETAARLSHPHVVALYDSGEADGFLYYVMPYVEGESLRARLDRDGPLPLAEVVELMRQIADALDYAHDQGVVHRDIKPENVLLARGHAFVTDFGVARAVARATEGPSSETLTRTGLAVGTPAYMSPEQAAGDREVDRRTDIYSLGCVVYEMLTGARPFTGTSAEQIAKRFRETPPPASRQRTGLPRAFDPVVARALAFVPADRFATAGEFVHALTDALGGRGAHGRWRTGRLWPVATLAGAGAVAVLGWWVALGRDAQESESSSRKTLAVLPFKNLGQPDDAYFADGVTEEITSRLAALAGLRVTSRMSADNYRTTTKPLAQVARELGVDYVLEGSVRWERSGGASSPGRVRVTPQLIRASDDSHVWTDRYDADATDVFRVQAAIAERVADALEVAIGGRERAALGARATSSFEAYNNYLRARELIPRSDLVSLRTAARLLEQAVRLDSQFALAYIELYRARMMASAFAVGDTTVAREGREALSAAIRLAPDLPEVRIARGFQYLLEQRDPVRAVQEFEWVKSRVPSSVEAAIAVGSAWMVQGRWAEARASFEEAIALDPQNPYAAGGAYGAAFATRDSAMARRYVDRLIAIQPDNPLYYGLKAVLAATLAANPREVASVMREAIARFGAPAAAHAILESPVAVLAHVDTETQSALAGVGLNTFPGDTAAYYFFKAALHRARRESVLERYYADSVIRFLEPRMQPGTEFRPVDYILPMSYAHLGRGATAIATAEQTVARVRGSPLPSHRVLALQVLAEVTAVLGHDDAAIDQLEYLLSIPSNISIPWLRVGTTWDSLRDSPRFQRLLERAEGR